ncbi:MAG: hypothetical protein AVDCRST_MAG96-2945 [uncultured Segetibacter sp.]|uniref:Uncharacterized protein n=1 Tax=uncultured Segetibacter sp. TaxID=481133 RepID=A0A6J4TG89_9BACT|nr:MAG: hypothetical protein AVDCRST_MAG96-2945 [uncultured Segetibacter sp.]
MKSFLFPTVVLLSFFSQAQYKVDSMCGSKVNLDKAGKLLARYQPQTPGASYVMSVKLAVDFLKNCPVSVKNGLPLYLTHCSMYRDGKGGFVGSSWPHNPIVVNGGLVQSLAIDWRNFSGDESMIDLARKALDHQIQFGTTPANWAWSNVPYASSDAGSVKYQGASQFDTAVTDENRGRGDGSFVLEADKIGEMGIHYLKFYQITGETKYLDAAIHCADALAKHVRKSGNSANGLDWKKLGITSPWPFRVRAETNDVLEDYTSHVVENLRLLDELIRIKDRIKLPHEKAGAYKNASNVTWDWLYSSEGPIKTAIWKGYFEDIRFDSINLNRVNNSPMEFARYLIKYPEYDKDVATTVPALIWWVKNTFGEKGMNAINEQTGCYLPMGSHTSRYASINALWYEHTGDRWYKEEAYRFFNHASYMAEPDGVVQTGHNWGAEIWFSDGYTDYIRHFMEGLAAVPEWAPAGENHLLKSSSVVQKIKYGPQQISYQTYDTAAKVVLRLVSKPVAIIVGGTALKETKITTAEGWTWRPLATGGVLRIHHKKAGAVSISLASKKASVAKANRSF